MVSEITNLPIGVAGFRLGGEVTKEDYDTVIFPSVKRKAEGQQHMKMLLILDTSLKNFSLGAWMSDALLALRYYTKWEKVAAVSDAKFVQDMVPVLGKFIPGESRCFSHAEEAQALEWVKQ